MTEPATDTPDEDRGTELGLVITVVSALIAAATALRLQLSPETHDQPTNLLMVALIITGMIMLLTTSVIFQPLHALRTLAPSTYRVSCWRLNAMTSSFSAAYAAVVGGWTTLNALGAMAGWAELASPMTAATVAVGLLLQPTIATTAIGGLEIQRWFTGTSGEYTGPGTQPGARAGDNIDRLMTRLKVAAWAAWSAFSIRPMNAALSTVGLALENERRWRQRAAAAGAGTAFVAFMAALADTPAAPAWLNAAASGTAPPILILALTPLGYALERAHRTDSVASGEAAERTRRVTIVVNASQTYREAGRNIVIAGAVPASSGTPEETAQ